MKPLFIIFFVAMTALPRAAGAQDSALANRLFLDANTLYAEAVQEADLQAKAALFAAAIESLQRIVDRVSGSNLAVQLATGQQVGPLSIALVSAQADLAATALELAAAEAEIARLTAEPAQQRAAALEVAVLDLQRELSRAKQDLSVVRSEYLATSRTLDNERQRFEAATSEAQVGELRATHKRNIPKRLENAEAGLAEARTKLAALTKSERQLEDELSKTTVQLSNTLARLGDREAEVAELRTQLDLALADELLAFRSLFFDRLRTSLSERPGVRFLGESVMMQSELLFRDTSIEMREGAEAPLATLARTLLSSSRDAPIGLDWILRVEMHADVQPLPKGSSFASEWNLSSRRAFIVANFLADQGVLEQNLAAVGFGSSRPLDPSGDQIAFRRNRRIEFHIVEK